MPNPVIDLTLDSFLIPDLIGYTQPFGTKVSRTEFNEGGLSTAEVNQNIMLAFAKQRPVPIAVTSDTTAVQYDAKMKFNSDIANTVLLTLGDGAYEGCTVTIVNLASVDNQVSVKNGSGADTRITYTLESQSMLHLVWSTKIVEEGGAQVTRGFWVNVQTKISLTAPAYPTAGDIWVE